MTSKLKQILQSAFYQLLVVYTLFILLIALGFLSKYTLQFHIFAFVLAFFGIAVLPNYIEKKEINKKWHYLLLIGIILLVLIIRVVPYIENSIPLGYDPGLYKYGIEKGLQNMDKWVLSGGMEPGFLYLMHLLKPFFSTDFMLTGLFIFFTLILGLSIYLFTKEIIGKEAALFSVLVYAFSIVQFKTFWYLYYKNVIGLSLMLFSMYFLIKYEKSEKLRYLSLFIILGGLILAVHRPTFYIFGISYFFYAFISPYKEKYDYRRLRINVISGVLILLIGMSFYLGKFLPAITNILPFVAQAFAAPGESPGTFMNFYSYQLSTLFYLPISLIGLFYFLKKKEINMIVIWGIINFAVVYFQFFFFNRFIIHLDAALIILSGAGFAILTQEKRRLSVFILLGLFISGGIAAYSESIKAKPLISKETLALIEEIPLITESEAKILVISSEYSPWVKGYSNRETIAPGLFDENLWSKEEWEIFWNTTDENETKEMLLVYERPIYLFAGTKRFNNPCFSVYLEDSGGKIYKYEC